MEEKIKVIKRDFFRKNGHFFGLTSDEQIHAAIDPWDNQKRYFSIKCSKEISDKFEKILIERVKDFFSFGYYFYHEDNHGTAKELRIQVELAEKLNEFFPDKWFVKDDKSSQILRLKLINDVNLLTKNTGVEVPIVDLEDNKKILLGATFPCDDYGNNVSGLLISSQKKVFDSLNKSFGNMINQLFVQKFDGRGILNNIYFSEFKQPELEMKYIPDFGSDKSEHGLIFIPYQAMEIIGAANGIITTKKPPEKAALEQKQERVAI